MATRILLAEAHGITRQGLRSLIEKEADMEVVGEAKDGRCLWLSGEGIPV